MIIHGKSILVYNSDGTVAVANSKSCNIDLLCNLIEVSSPSSGGYKHYIPGVKEWKVNIGFFVSSVRNPFMKIGQQLSVRIGLSETDATFFDGFVSNVTVETISLVTMPMSVFYDTTRNKFLAFSQSKYYSSWRTGNDYMNPSIGDTFKYDNIVYMWLGSALSTSETLQGSVIVKECKISSVVGNLSQGSIILKGTGPLI